MIKRLYYRIFVSCMTTIKQSKKSSDIWRVLSFLFMSIAMTLNVIWLWLIIQTHISHGFTNPLIIQLVDNRYNGLLNLVIYILLPIMLMNYFLIFYKERYWGIIEKYPEAHKKSISGVYFLISWIGLAIYFIFVVLQR